MSLSERLERGKGGLAYRVPPTPPKPKLQLKKGMRININGTLFKVIAVRENGKAAIRPE